MKCFRPAPILLALSFAVVSGCRDREIVAYRAPKDPPPAAPGVTAEGTNNLPAGHPSLGPATSDSGAPMAQTPVPTADGADLTWTVPAGWKPKPGSPMRKGSFAVGDDGDLSITAFPGVTGGLEANLNRWRSQMSLPAQESAKLLAATEHISSPGLDFVVVDYAGGGRRLLGAVVEFGGNSWFFKLTGPDALVAAHKAEFVAFLQTVRTP
ncbi:MAG TPA: hypothetical protein VGM73_13235 [Candidatus Didemnitutus sp.]